MVPLNYLAILVATVINMVIGYLWYSSLLFGNVWMKALGIDPMNKSTVEKMKQDAPKAMLGMLVGAFLMSYILAHFVYYAGAKDVLLGAATGWWLWLGFIMPPLLSLSLFEKRKWALFWISSGYYLLILLITSALLATWQ